MRLPLFMALRYLFSRKRVGAINIISGISVLGVAFGTAALLCTLSVFNGFRDLIGSLYTAFDPPLMVVPTQGKFATTDDPSLLQMMRQPEVKAASFTLEDHALILFRGRPTVITLKGVDDNYDRVTGIRSILYGTGRYELHRGTLNYGIPGIGLASTMGGIDYGTLQSVPLARGNASTLPIRARALMPTTSPRLAYVLMSTNASTTRIISSPRSPSHKGSLNNRVASRRSNSAFNHRPTLMRRNAKCNNWQASDLR